MMIDCGPASTYKLYRAGFDISQVDHLFFTHHHSDHNADYPCFLLTRFVLSIGQEPPLKVYGPTGTERLTQKLIGEESGAFWPDISARMNDPHALEWHYWRGGASERDPPRVEAADLGDGSVISDNGWQVTTTRTKHAQPYLESLAYRVDTEAGSIVFTGDTRPTKNLTKLAQGADVLVAECNRSELEMGEAQAAAEMGSRGAAETARDSGVRHLILVHQLDSLDDEPSRKKELLEEIGHLFSGNVIWGEELLEVTINGRHADERFRDKIAE